MFACAGFFNLKLEDIFEVRHFFYLNYFVPQKWCDNQERNGEAIIRLLLLYKQSRLNKCCLTIRGTGNKVGRKGNLELRVCVGGVYNGQVSLLL
jgi:hypothetical protein